MKIRRFSSHYALMPDGTLGKWPVVEISGDGEIVSVLASPGGFKEQPSLEFHGGLLMPGFIDLWAECKPLSLDVINLNRHVAAGTLVLGCKPPIASTLCNRVYPPFIIEDSNNAGALNTSLIVSSVGFSILDRLKNLSIERPDISLNELLLLVSAVGADQLGMSHLFGRLKPELYPGLLVIEQLDLQNMRLTPQTRARWLVQPKNPLL